jgi:hypothetical protein
VANGQNEAMNTTGMVLARAPRMQTHPNVPATPALSQRAVEESPRPTDQRDEEAARSEADDARDEYLANLAYTD